MLTFGLLSRNKGLETVIRALPQIARTHPEIQYVILGNTHPGILKESGEEYRDYLAGLATGFWKNTSEISRQWQVDQNFKPQKLKDIDQRIDGWNRAVRAAKANVK